MYPVCARLSFDEISFVYDSGATANDLVLDTERVRKALTRHADLFDNLGRHDKSGLMIYKLNSVGVAESARQKEQKEHEKAEKEELKKARKRAARLKRHEATGKW